MSGAPMQTVYCVPIDEQGEDIQQDPVVQIPLGNIYSDQQSTNTLLRMLLNFGGIAVLIICIMAGTPFFYKSFITEIIRNGPNIKINENDPISKQDRLAFADILSLLLISTTSFLLLSGFAPTIDDQLGAMFGVFFIIGTFIGFARMQFERTKTAEDFYSEYLKLEKETTYSTFDISDFLNLTLIWKIIRSRFYYDKGSMNGYNIGCTVVAYAILFGMMATNAALFEITPNPGLIFFCTWFPIYLPSFLQLSTTAPP